MEVTTQALVQCKFSHPVKEAQNPGFIYSILTVRKAMVSACFRGIFVYHDCCGYKKMLLRSWVISSLLERWHQRAQAHQHLAVRQLKQRERERVSGVQRSQLSLESDSLQSILR